jgi:hypothetical protein
MRRIAAVFAFLVLCLGLPQAAGAVVRINIDLGSQTMRVSNGSGESYTWPVSTARSGFVTPRGVYKPQRLVPMHYSRKYNMSPMPHSIFFRGGYAIHGTSEARALGRPASHGCVRLSKANAAALFAMVKREGAVIAINGTSPSSTMVASKKSKAQAVAARGGSYKAKYAGKPRWQALGYAPMPVGPAPVKVWMRDPTGGYRLYSR